MTMFSKKDSRSWGTLWIFNRNRQFKGRSCSLAFDCISNGMCTHVLPGFALLYNQAKIRLHLDFALHLYAGALRVSVRIRPRSCFCWLKTIPDNSLEDGLACLPKEFLDLTFASVLLEDQLFCLGNCGHLPSEKGCMADVDASSRLSFKSHM